MSLNMTYLDKVKYKSQDFNQRFADIFGNGILKDTDFPVTYPSTANMTLNIGIGTAIIDGYRINNDAVTTLTVNPADTTNPRIDIVELGYSVSTDANGMTTGNAVLQIKQGVAAASPVEPGADTGFIKLYSISVAANATSISSSFVTDKRALVPLNVNGSQISIGGAQKTIYQQSTAPLNPVDEDLWIDTSVTPNVWNRYDESTTSWVSVSAEDWVKSFGLGSSAADISGTDLNVLVETGFYRGNNLINGYTSDWYFIEHIRHNDSYSVQIASRFTGGVLAQYQRFNNNGTWTSWDRKATFGDFTNQLSGNGYQKLPNGLILQWGTTAFTSFNAGTESYLDCPFPVAFPNSCLWGLAQANGEDSNTNAVNIFTRQPTYTTTKINVRMKNADTVNASDGKVTWFAIGN